MGYTWKGEQPEEETQEPEGAWVWTVLTFIAWGGIFLLAAWIVWLYFGGGG